MEHVNPADERRRLQASGEIGRDAARRIAAGFSRRIPLATTVSSVRTGAEVSVSITTDGRMAPNAAPFEYAEQHPLFGNRRHWYRQPHRPYMATAWLSAGDAMVDEYARVVDDWCDDLGYDQD